MFPGDLIERTADGSATLRSSRYSQYFHNRNGALTQSRHVFLHGTLTDAHRAPRVLEIGFGVGLNFMTTLADARSRGVPLAYLAYEFDPQPAAVLNAIGLHHPACADPLWRTLLEKWAESTSQIAPERSDSERCDCRCLKVSDPMVNLEIRFVDATTDFLPIGWASAIYLDGFSPDVNAELWTPDLIAKLAAALQPCGWLATYSAAGAVKRALARSGLIVSKCAGVAGKREFLRAQRPVLACTAA